MRKLRLLAFYSLIASASWVLCPNQVIADVTGTFDRHEVTVTWWGSWMEAGGTKTTVPYNTSNKVIPLKGESTSYAVRGHAKFDGTLTLDFPDPTPPGSFGFLKFLDFKDPMVVKLTVDGTWTMESVPAGNSWVLESEVGPADVPQGVCPISEEEIGPGISVSETVSVTSSCERPSLKWPSEQGDILVYKLHSFARLTFRLLGYSTFVGVTVDVYSYYNVPIELVDFHVVDYTPEDNQKNIKWNNPNITIEFSHEVKTSTARGDTIILDYRDQSGTNWVAVPTTVAMISETKAQVTPISALKDGIRYRMRVLDGQYGVLEKNGSELTKAAEWFFWTMVNLDGQTQKLYAPNETRDKIQITWFNVSRNEDLIPGKPVLNRIYVLWGKKDDVFDEDQVAAFDADVTFEKNAASPRRVIRRIRRPDGYDSYPNQKRMAQNTINFYYPSGSTGSEEDYNLKIEPVPQPGTPKVFETSATADVRSKSPKLEFEVWACEMAGWYDGVDEGELESGLRNLQRAREVVTDMLPFVSSAYKYKGQIPRDERGFNMTYTTTKFSDKFGGQRRFVNTTVPSWHFWTKTVEVEEFVQVADILRERKPKHHKIIVGLIPDDGLLPGTVATMTYPGVILVKSSMPTFSGKTEITALAHEIAHAYGAAVTTSPGCTDTHNDDGKDIEGFNVYKKLNKSSAEGNSEADKRYFDECSGGMYSTSVLPLMHPGEQEPIEKYTWIKPENYTHILDQLAPKGWFFQKAIPGRAALNTGDYMVVKGRIDASGDIASLNPLYRVTERHIEGPSGTGYTAELFSGENGGGTSLGSYDFNTEQMSLHKGDGTILRVDSQTFAFTVLFDDAAQSLVIKGPNNSLTINKSYVGVGAPIAAFTNPTDGDTISGIVNLVWTGSDDGGTIYSRLEHSLDGTTWSPISGQMVDVNTYSMDTTLMPTGANQKLALIAYDGFNTTRKEINVTINNNVTVNSTSPLAGEADVSEGHLIKAYFVSDMGVTTINNNTFKLLEGSSQVEGQVMYNSAANSAIFAPTNILKSNTTYTARLSSGPDGVKDIDGNTLDANYEWSFTTGISPINPQVKNVSPEHGVTDVTVNALIQATFENDIDPTTLDTNSFVVMHGNGTAVGGTVSYNATTKSTVFTPDVELDADTTYTATITTAVADSQGLPLEADYSWNFMTGSDRSIGIRVVKVSSDMGEDTDSDGLYEKLIIKVQVEATNAGTYQLSAQLKDKHGEDIASTSTSQSFSQSGVYLMYLEYIGTDIGSHGIDGRYELTSIYIYNTSDSSISESPKETYQTYPYKANEFTDNDGILDSWEMDNFGDLTTVDDTTDYDDDGLLDKDEYAKNTDPKNPDSDYDDMPDGWEVDNKLNPMIDDSANDADGDGESNGTEYANGTDPTDPMSARRGDINDDKYIDLADAITALQVVSGLDIVSGNLTVDGGVNNDQRIGLEEAIYVMQKLSDLREPSN